ncbi:4'-phosphopantetheinyl transferase family protein [Reichenbachiella versicolor]|uniref:4'-phosphopantetheinyl transferase family protein n=1 Tax=Reichenbachiella versicolor TaxID=1821036 RepID=UPI000D6DD7A9|nr:4'-phosphopantetheinyl transferase superfamily protein [Reichenbachiella versicolor]
MIEFIKSVSVGATLGVWKVTESIEDLGLMVHSRERQGAENYHPRKKKEHFASRVLIAKVVRSLGLDYHGIVKDDHGKPFLGGYDLNLSITHTDDFVGCLIHKTAPCGMDIENLRPQLFKIKNKYLNLTEQKEYGSDLEMLTKAWSAKETIYKIYGRKNLNFSENIQVTAMSDSQIEASVKTEEVHQEYTLQVERLEKSFLVYSV